MPKIFAQCTVCIHTHTNVYTFLPKNVYTF